MSFLKNLLNRFAFHLGVTLQNRQAQIAQATLPKFRNSPKNLVINLPRRIVNPHRMYIGDDVYIGPGSFLMAVERYTGIIPPPIGISAPDQYFEPKLVIGHRVTATGALQVSVLQKIIIEDDVMFATNVFICDGLHGYNSVDIPFKYQEMNKISPIVIKHGCWIGQNVVIMPGVTIGEMSILGANSVITNDIPDRCIAVGSPARVIKKWNESTNTWEEFSP